MRGRRHDRFASDVFAADADGAGTVERRDQRQSWSGDAAWYNNRCVVALLSSVNGAARLQISASCAV
jgi:hypothetical protein